MMTGGTTYLSNLEEICGGIRGGIILGVQVAEVVGIERPCKVARGYANSGRVIAPSSGRCRLETRHCSLPTVPLSLRGNNEVRVPSHGGGIHVLLSSMSMRCKVSSWTSLCEIVRQNIFKLY